MRHVTFKTREYAVMMATAATSTPAQQAAAMQQNNMLARQLIAGRSVKMTQQIFSQTINPANTPQLNVVPRNVGLILGFWVEVNATLALTAGSYALTNLGPANALQQIVFTDLNNNTRLQTTGWHLHANNSAKKKWPFGAARTLTGYPINYGSNFGGNVTFPNANQNLFQAPNPFTVAAGGVQMLYWVPLAYSDFDLRGAIYANVVNATMNLQLTPTPSVSAFVGAAADPTLAVYQATTGTGGAWASMTVNVYQVYYDQLPVAQNGAPVLPLMDLSTIYELKNTTLAAIVANQDFPIPYSNFRDFLSTTVIYNNQNAGVYPVAGTDIAYWALQSANFTNIFKVAPKYIGMFNRAELQDDFPTGMYYFDTRAKPISTVQYGNIQLILNASAVNGAPSVLVGFENFALTNTLVGAASLA